jgi:hypothetical protein
LAELESEQQQRQGGEGMTSSAVLDKESSTTTGALETDNNEKVSSSSSDVESSSSSSSSSMSESQKLMQQIKEAGTAGILSYALWEFGFWAVSVPVVLFGYVSVMGHWPDLSNPDDTTKLGAEAFAFVNFARFAVPLRIGLALSTTPWIQNNIVDRFWSNQKKNKNEMQEQ